MDTWCILDLKDIFDNFISILFSISNTIGIFISKNETCYEILYRCYLNKIRFTLMYLLKFV